MTDRHSREEYVRPTPLDLPAFLPYACGQLQAPFALRVVLQQQDEYVSKTIEDKVKKGKPGKSTIQATSRTLDSAARTESASGGAGAADDDDDVIALVAVHDAAGRLLQLRLRRAPVPRLLLKVLAMTLRYQPLLAGLSLRWCALHAAALLELAQLLPLAHLTELCLDDSPVPQGDHALLLAGPSPLRSLSLARCELEDAECERIAAQLAHPLPASRTLVMLALAGNRIGDAGAAALADALRGNRALQYLNLCGNRLTDDGAAALLRSLAEFPLTSDELVARRGRLLAHLRARDELFRKCYGELAAALADRAPDDASRLGRRRAAAPPATSVRSRKSVAGMVGSATAAGDALATRAQLMAAELVGPYADPFGPDETVTRDGYPYSAGNTTLCALNLAYNALGYATAARLAAVLRYQDGLARKAGTGLVRVLLDGNALPHCAELQLAHELLEKALVWKLAKPQKKPDKPPGKAKSK